MFEIAIGVRKYSSKRIFLLHFSNSFQYHSKTWKNSAHRFLAFWDTFEFVDMVPAMFPGPVGSNVAYCNLRSNLTRGICYATFLSEPRTHLGHASIIKATEKHSISPIYRTPNETLQFLKRKLTLLCTTRVKLACFQTEGTRT